MSTISLSDRSRWIRSPNSVNSVTPSTRLLDASKVSRF